jgi:hypothetical protein
MRTKSPSLRVAFSVAVLAVSLLAGACGTASARGTSAKDIKQLPKDLLTGTYQGLTPEREDVSGALGDQQANAYVEAVGLYSLRHNDLLEATLQISKLTKSARVKDPDFQQQMVSQIGGTAVQGFVMSGRRVYRSSARKQSLSSWFSGNYLLVLSVRDTYPYPRSLLRTLLSEVKP